MAEPGCAPQPCPRAPGPRRIAESRAQFLAQSSANTRQAAASCPKALTGPCDVRTRGVTFCSVGLAVRNSPCWSGEPRGYSLLSLALWALPTAKAGSLAFKCSGESGRNLLSLQKTPILSKGQHTPWLWCSRSQESSANQQLPPQPVSEPCSCSVMDGDEGRVSAGLSLLLGLQSAELLHDPVSAPRLELSR